jgi:hypothetical protein
MTRNFSEFQGQEFTQGSTKFTFLMKHPKKDAFIYNSTVIVSQEQKEENEEAKNFFVIGWSVKEALKFINKKLGGKIEGQSKTTCSGYTRLHDGRRVRISDHPAIAGRSKSDIDFVMNYRSNSISLDGVRVFTANAKSTVEELFQSLVNAITNA